MALIYPSQTCCSSEVWSIHLRHARTHDMVIRLRLSGVLTLLTLLAALPLSAASPITTLAVDGPTQVNTERRTVDCYNIHTGIDASCWGTLNMTQWVLHWFSTHTCLENEGFSNCFLRINGLPVADCTVINPQSCGADITNNISKPEVFYTLYNIYTINNFFNSWWLATQFAASRAALKIDPIVELLDPVKTQNVLLQNILTGLVSGLAFIPTPGDIFPGISDMTKVAMKSGITALVVAPSIIRSIFPEDTDDTRMVQMAQLKSQLGNLEDGISNRLGPGLQTAQNDVTSFVQMASTGAFSAHPPFALDTQTEALDLAFTTFLVSTCIMSNNWQGAVAVDTSPQALATNGTAAQYDIDCDGYDANNVCNAWWYDEDNNDAYTLTSLDNLMDNPYAKIHGILSNGWSTGAQLFGGARRCSQAQNLGKGVLVDVSNGSITFDCLSQLKMCTFDKHCTSTKCEFSDCDSEPGFRDGFENSRTSDTRTLTVPAGYLGPMLMQFNTKVVHDTS